MMFRHPVLFFYYRHGLFIGRRSNIKNLKNISFGNDIHFGNDVRIQSFSNEKNVFIDEGCYFCHRVTLLALGKISIGRNSLFASDVCIVSESHSIDASLSIPYKNQGIIGMDVSIGSNCWIGEKVMILPGVSIGDNCIIGAGSVVTKGIPNCCIAVGNPAKVIKKFNFTLKIWERINN